MSTADDDESPPVDMSGAALIYHLAQRIMRAQSDPEASRPDSRAIPRAVATWGDLAILAPSLAALLAHLYPQLKDEETLDALLRDVLTSSASGRPN